MRLLLQLLLQSLWYMLPAFIANVTPIILAKFGWLPSLARPISSKLFGENKTWRGLFGGIFMGILTMLIQWFFEPFFHSDFVLFEYRFHDIFQNLTLGFLLSFGILAMDLLKSFVKRRIGISSGQAWVPFDALDSWGGLFLGFLVFIPPLPYLNIILFGGPILHMVSNVLGYIFRLKKVWW